MLHRTRSVLGLTRVVACGWTDHARRASSSRAPGHDGLRTRPHTSPTPRNMREHAARLFITSSAACAVMIIGIAVPTTIFAQRGGFVTTLGTDTVQVEQFVRRDRAITGVLVTRTPFVKMTRYEITLDDRDRLASYAQQVTDGLGASLTPDPGPASLMVTGDTIRRTARARDGTVVTQAIAAPGGVYPVGTIPIGASFAVFELAVAPLLDQALSSRPTLARLLPTAVQSAPSYTPVLFIAKDSVEVDYFGQGRFGFRFDNHRRLLRSANSLRALAGPSSSISMCRPHACSALWSRRLANSGRYQRFWLPKRPNSTPEPPQPPPPAPPCRNAVPP